MAAGCPQLLLATIYSPVASATDRTFVADLTQLVSKFTEPDPLRLTVACMYAGLRSMPRHFLPLFLLSVMFDPPPSRAPFFFWIVCMLIGFR